MALGGGGGGETPRWPPELGGQPAEQEEWGWETFRNRQRC